MYRECAYARADGDLALCWHVDAEAAGVVREAGVAGDNAVAINCGRGSADKAGARSGPRARPAVPSVVRNKTTPVPSTRRPSGFATNVRAGRHRVPAVAWMDLDPIAAALTLAGSWACLLSSQRSRVNCGERQRETQTIMYSFEARSSSLSTESR